MASLRVGILGSGGWASRHATALEASEKVKLVAVAGGSRAPAFAEKFGLRLDESPEALCQATDVDIVDVKPARKRVEVDIADLDAAGPHRHEPPFEPVADPVREAHENSDGRRCYEQQHEQPAAPRCHGLAR